MDESGLLPSVRRKVYMILAKEEERYGEGKTRRSRDHRGVGVVGRGTES